MTDFVGRRASDPVDYLLVAIGVALLGGVAVGAVSGVPFRVAVGGGSAFAACLVAVGLARFP